MKPIKRVFQDKQEILTIEGGYDIEDFSSDDGDVNEAVFLNE